jgi:beta-phosphoglucomutase-like phosphatase (HAD superfamily)
MSATGHGSYSAPPQVETFDGLLFDFDGTIVDSTDGTYTKLAVRWLFQVMSTPSGSRGKRLPQLIMLLTVVGNSNCEALAQVCGINMDET